MSSALVRELFRPSAVVTESSLDGTIAPVAPHRQPPSPADRRIAARLAARAASQASGWGPALLNHFVIFSVVVAAMAYYAATATGWPRAAYAGLGAISLWRLVTQLRMRAALRSPLAVVVAVAGPEAARVYAGVLGRTLRGGGGGSASALAGLAARTGENVSRLARVSGCAGRHLPLCPHRLRAAGLDGPGALHEALVTGTLPGRAAAARP
jgi:hypothetical protein